jgi:hypothetical protein
MVSIHDLQVLPTMNCFAALTVFAGLRGSTNLMKGLSVVCANALIQMQFKRNTVIFFIFKDKNKKPSAGLRMA